jgi:hypothetical protein
MSGSKGQIDIGKWFEDKIQRELRFLQSSKGLYFHRLKDSRSAGRIVGNSPADFLVAYQGQCQLWEAKSSQVHPSLRSCLAGAVDSGQVGHHQMWHLNGLDSWFIFYSDLVAEVEFWRGRDVVFARAEGKPLDKTQAYRRVSLAGLDQAMLDVFASTEKAAPVPQPVVELFGRPVDD